MGGVIIGGLVTSTVVTLFLLPALYLRFGQGQAEVEELDLRDLWEVREIREIHLPDPESVPAAGRGRHQRRRGAGDRPMMRRIVAASLKFRFLVLAAAVGMILLGTMQLKHDPVDVFPEFAPPRVEVQTPSQGLSPSEVESLVTVPLEEALNGVPGLDVIRSKSVPQLSSIELIFKPGTDLLHARQWVAERMAETSAQLPNWAGPPVMIQPLSSTSRVMKIGLTSKTMNLMQQSMMAYWTIRTRLLQVPGVANVPIWGERIQLLNVQADPAKLAANDVSLDKVMEVTAQSLDSGLLAYADGGNAVGTGGFVETANQRLTVEHKLPITSAADMAQVVVEERDGKALRLGDVADVEVRRAAAHRRGRHQRRARPHADRREAALGQHPRRDQGRRARAGGTQARPRRHGRSTRRSSGRPTSSRPRCTTSGGRSSSARC